MTQLTARLQNEQPRLFSDVATLLGSATTYTAGSNNTVTAGQIIQTQAEGISYQVAPEAATDQHVTTAGGAKLYRVSQRNIEVTVGGGGQFSTINAALSFLDGQRRTYGSNATATIRLLSGFVMAEQVMCRDGLDLSWITIVSNDPVVTVIGSAITQTERDTSTRRPIISAVRNASAPVLGCVLSVDNSSPNDTFGLYAQSGGTVTVAPASGVINADFNCFVWAGRVVTLLRNSGNYWDEGNRPKFTGGKKGALNAWNGSYVSAVGWDMDGSFEAVICGGGSYMDAQRSRARNSTGDFAYLSRDASVLNARLTDASGAAGNGYIVFHTGFLNARHFDNEGSQCANNCGLWGFNALSGGIIEAEDATAINCGLGSAKAEDGGQISVRGLRGQGGTFPGIFALKGGRITAENAVITSGATNCIRAERAGWVSAPFSTLTATTSAVFSHLNGEIDVSNATVTSTADNALFSQDGGRITGHQVIARASASSVLCRRGGYAVVTEGDLRKNGTSEQSSDVSISFGAIVQMHGSQGGVNVAVNTISASGIVFK